jgi:hypothetical protein
VIVENRTAVAVVPRPEMRPFFETLSCQVPDEMTRWRKRRGSNPHLQNLLPRHQRVPVLDFRVRHSVGPRWPSRRDTTSPLRYRARARRLTPEQESKIRALAGTKSLRSLAADFGVSHETIRSVVRQDRSIAV